MSAIALPSRFCANSFSMRMQTAQNAFASPFGGSEQVIDLDNDRWLISLTLANRRFEDAAQIEAFIASLRGMTNTVAIYHWIRKVPRGTMRGAPTSQAASVGARSLTLNTTAGVTLLAGDMIGVNGLLLQVAADAVANGSGVMVAPIVNSLRTAVAGGTAVAWDKPTAPFRLVSNSSVQYIPGYATEVSLDFAEAIG